MGPVLLHQQLQALRSRAVRCRRMGELLGDAAVAAKLNEFAAELDDRIVTFEIAREAILATEEGPHRIWTGLSIESLMPSLRAQIALPTSSQRATAARWRELSRLWLEDARGSTDNPDKEALAAWAFEIAQLAENMTRELESEGA